MDMQFIARPANELQNTASDEAWRYRVAAHKSNKTRLYFQRCISVFSNIPGTLLNRTGKENPR
jgi:hypothetical protein